MLATCLEKNFSSNQAPHSTTIPTCLAAWLPACPRACLPARLPACAPAVHHVSNEMFNFIMDEM